MISRFLGLVGARICGFNLQKYIIPMILSNNLLINRLLMVNDSWLMAQGWLGPSLSYEPLTLNNRFINEIIRLCIIDTMCQF